MSVSPRNGRPDKAAPRPTVVIVGAGAAGTLTAIHLRTAGRRSSSLEVVLLDPATAGAAGSPSVRPTRRTCSQRSRVRDERVPRGPGPLRRVERRPRPVGDGGSSAFLPRRRFALYLDDTLAQAWRRPPVSCRCATCGPAPPGCVVRRTGSPSSPATAGTLSPTRWWSPPGCRRWATAGHRTRCATRRSSSPIPGSPARSTCPSRPGRTRGRPDGRHRAHDGGRHPLLSGPDARPDRVLHAVSRSGRLPKAHAEVLKLAAIPDISGWGSTLEEVREQARQHVLGGAPRRWGLAPGHRRSPVPGLGSLGAPQRCRPRRVPRPRRRSVERAAAPHGTVERNRHPGAAAAGRLEVAAATWWMPDPCPAAAWRSR